MPNKSKLTTCVIFGCEQIMVDFMRFLYKRKDVKVALVVTCEFLEDQLFDYESVAQEGKKLGMPVIDSKIITEEIIRKIESLQPDIIFSLFYRRVLPAEILNVPPLGCVNIHPGKLPQYKGLAPAVHALLNGDKTFGITIHQMDRGIDTGDILIQKEFPIYANETGFELHLRSMRLCTKLLKDNFYNIINERIVPRKQKGRGSYYGIMDGLRLIDWRKGRIHIRNLIGGHARPYRNMYTYMLNKYFFINRATIVNGKKQSIYSPGKIVGILSNDRPVVSCSDGHIVLEDYEVSPGYAAGEKSIYLKIGNFFGKSHY